MFTTTEKKYLALTLIFLATGTGIKAYKHTKVKIGPMVDSALVYQDALAKQNSKPNADSLSLPEPGFKPDSVQQLDSLESESGFGAGKPPKSPHRTARAQALKANFTGKISINQATQVDLARISGLGPKTAQFIVKYRNEHGPFKDLQELLQIKGIGEKKLEKFRPFLIL